jgi:hypothetical protein
MVEHAAFNREVAGSSPAGFTKYGLLAQLVEQVTLNH